MGHIGAQKNAVLIDQILSVLPTVMQNQKSSDDAQLVEKFVRIFYGHILSEDVRSVSPKILAKTALGLWQFGLKRDGEEALIRVYPAEEKGGSWDLGNTIVDVITNNMPFLVDSITAAINRVGLDVHVVIHPVMHVKRDKKGVVTDITTREIGKDPEEKGWHTESFMQFRIDEQSDAESIEALKHHLQQVLAEVTAAVEDWMKIRKQVRSIKKQLPKDGDKVLAEDVTEAKEFLNWLDDEHFTFLGYREYLFSEDGGKPSLEVITNSGLGILREGKTVAFDGLRNFDSLPPDIFDFMRRSNILLISKSNRKSVVHRDTHMDAIFVKSFDKDGKVIGEKLILGLFTSSAYNRSTRYIPYLRTKVQDVIQKAGFDPAGHDGKALTHILETFPRDEIFQIGERELFDISLGIMHSQERARPALFVRFDPFERFVSCFFYVSRERYNTDIRKMVCTKLEEAFDGLCEDFFVQISDSPMARVHVIVRTTPNKIPKTDLSTLEATLIELSRSWSDRLREALLADRAEEQALAMLRRYGAAFSSGYTENVTPAEAIEDIDHLEQVIASGKISIHLRKAPEGLDHPLRFRIYHQSKPVPLSSILPMLEEMGLRSMTERPFEVRPAGQATSIWIHEFALEAIDGDIVDLSAVRDTFHDMFHKIWEEVVESDGFNRLVLRAGLGWREIQMMRAYAKFLRQARFSFSQDVIEQTLAAWPEIVRLIVSMFKTMHDPNIKEDRDILVKGLEAALSQELDKVSNIDEDRILKRFINVVQSTLRTNYFQSDAAGEALPYLSFKFDSGMIEDLPRPCPYREIFVYSPRVEAVHLRGGKVARGGIRWSDRRDDFRTEILGLMKAQMVKNTVIIPVGSKGGFVVKHLPPPEAGREAQQKEVIECYSTMMRAMLEITDNLDENGTIIAPPNTVRRDGDDPYLVVAADKGTATFSDIANSISEEKDFWLNDAFASGGSAGYDHKKMGITARGAWESVKRHFRELGVNCQEEDFTCIGVGDMSGDVFGNGMLLSRHIKLIGAFNHLHIFCDPNPDAETSFKERQRLFNLPRSNWADYDETKLSNGAMIFDRSAKRLDLTPEIKQAFGIEADHMAPDELIQAMLKAQTDLLWFGGIGTYIKSVDENHLDVGDKVNDSLRINAKQLGAKVIGEGANLAVTQAARIEAAEKGVKLNTDAIDNSAGVDTSDHEVNIKILLRDAIAKSKLKKNERNKLLESMTDEVAELVLRDNYLQTQALSMAEASASYMLEQHAKAIRVLERDNGLDRELENLPDEDEINFRRMSRRGLTRPELSVLMAYAKIRLYEQLLASKVPDDAMMTDELISYFPSDLRAPYSDLMSNHPLKREIIATGIANSLINRMGLVRYIYASDASARPESDVARAYIIVHQIFGVPDLWTEIEAQDNKIPAAAQTRMLAETSRMIERGVGWFLTYSEGAIDLSSNIAMYSKAFKDLTGCLEDIMGPEEHGYFDKREAEFLEMGISAELARKVASLQVLVAVLDIGWVANQTGQDIRGVGSTYFSLGERLGLRWLRDQARRLPIDDPWIKQATSAIIGDMFQLQTSLTRKISRDGAEMEDWLQNHQSRLSGIDSLLAELRHQNQVDLAMLAVANRTLRAIGQ